MGTFKYHLDKFLKNRGDLPEWNQHLPDELCAQILTLEDFTDFLKFANENLDSELLEFGCEDTAEFLARLPTELEDPEFVKYVNEKGIKSDLGRIAYAFILSFGN